MPSVHLGVGKSPFLSSLVWIRYVYWQIECLPHRYRREKICQKEITSSLTTTWIHWIEIDGVLAFRDP